MQSLPELPEADNSAHHESVLAAGGKVGKLVPVTAQEFFTELTVNAPGLQCVVTTGREGRPNDHAWPHNDEPFGEWAAQRAHERKPAYFSPAVFTGENVSRYAGRTKNNVVALPGFWIDVEASAEKFAKPGGADAGYADNPPAAVALKKFVHKTGLHPSFVVLTGSGGMHLYFLVDRALSPTEFLPRAKALVALCAAQGFKIDAQCTTDAARIMRAPGSLHQSTGGAVLAARWRVERYALDVFDTLAGYAPGATCTSAGAVEERRFDAPINADIVGEYPKFSYAEASKRCGAMAQAAAHCGRDTPYLVWVLTLRAAALSVEGPAFAHKISSDHPDYDAGKTDKKINSLTGGPAGCDAWAAAYGAGGPCGTCALRGKLKNPAIQLGTPADTAPPGALALADPENSPDWVDKLNSRFALVRLGTALVVADFQTPSMSGRGVARDIGFLDISAFRAMFNGRFAPIKKAGDKPRPLSAAWLAHRQRRQYEGLVFSPGDAALPGNILNLWQGFAVAPIAGDVSLWLEVLAALVPNEVERRYVLYWLAWKIQNPGGVPDTLLIFRGAKGTGKNSLFDPVIILFGRHAMLADDPELIAGRFTWHLMSLSFAVLDEAIFVGDPRQADRIKSRVTAKTMHYEKKGADPVAGVNCCAYVMLTNHDHAWQATTDERRAVVIDVGESLRGALEFWSRYHAWVAGPGPAALLHYLQSIDLTGFNPRVIPKGEALRKQIEQTALRGSEAAWWHQCLTEGAIRWRDGTDRVIHLDESGETEIDRAALRLSYEQSAAARGRSGTNWASVARRLASWAGPGGIKKIRPRAGSAREWRDVLPALCELRAAFTAATQVEVSE